MPEKELPPDRRISEPVIEARPRTGGLVSLVLFDIGPLSDADREFVRGTLRRLAEYFDYVREAG